MTRITIPVAAMLFSLLAMAAHADTIQFLDVPTHVNDGSFYVLPYEVSIDGAPQLVACYDIFDDVSFGDTWQANLLDIYQAADSGFFSPNSDALAKYERVAWLDAQQYQTPAQQIGLQYAIWDVFGTYRSTPESLAYDSAANAAAALGYQEFDFSGARYIEQVGGSPGQSGTKQAFVFWQPAPGQSSLTGQVPEPHGGVLTIFGMLFLAGVGLKLRNRATSL